MRVGDNRRLAISWTQTELDGLEAAPQAFLKIGAAWSWRGSAISLAETSQNAVGYSNRSEELTQGHPSDLKSFTRLDGFALGVVVLTNGSQTFQAFLHSVSGEANPVLVFEGECPARDQEYWVTAFTEYKNNSEAIRLDRTVVAFPARSKAEESWANAPAARVGATVE